MRDKRVKEMVLFSMFLAIIVVLTLVPNIGYIPLAVASITIIHVPIIIGGIVLGRKYSWALGLVFGLGSLLIAYVRPQTIMDPYFQNPLISVVPRVLFGIVAFEIYNLLSKFLKGKLCIIAVGITAFVSTILHTVFVAGACFIVARGQMITDGYLAEDGSLFTAIGLFIVSGLLEATFAVLVSTPVCSAVFLMNDDKVEDDEDDSSI